jgi:hypothetical protein
MRRALLHLCIQGEGSCAALLDQTTFIIAMSELEGPLVRLTRWLRGLERSMATCESTAWKRNRDRVSRDASGPLDERGRALYRRGQ